MYKTILWRRSCFVKIKMKQSLRLIPVLWVSGRKNGLFYTTYQKTRVKRDEPSHQIFIWEGTMIFLNGSKLALNLQKRITSYWESQNCYWVLFSLNRFSRGHPKSDRLRKQGGKLSADLVLLFGIIILMDLTI